jgi:hypothetical protein
LRSTDIGFLLYGINANVNLGGAINLCIEKMQSLIALEAEILVRIKFDRTDFTRPDAEEISVDFDLGTNYDSFASGIRPTITVFVAIAAIFIHDAFSRGDERRYVFSIPTFENLVSGGMATDRQPCRNYYGRSLSRTRRTNLIGAPS